MPLFPAHFDRTSLSSMQQSKQHWEISGPDKQGSRERENKSKNNDLSKERISSAQIAINYMSEQYFLIGKCVTSLIMAFSKKKFSVWMQRECFCQSSIQLITGKIVGKWRNSMESFVFGIFSTANGTKKAHWKLTVNCDFPNGARTNLVEKIKRNGCRNAPMME